MYTFIISAAFFLLLSAIIFKGKIAQNQFKIGAIVFIGTFLVSVIVNGVIGLKIPYTNVLSKQKQLFLKNSEILTKTDTLNLTTYLNYDLEIKNKDTTQYLDFNAYYDYLHNDETTINFLEEGDTIPYYERFREVRLTNNKWLSKSILPRGEKSFVFYIPNDSVHNILMNYINTYFFEYGKSNLTAQFN